jgi:hypothetical protein
MQCEESVVKRKLVTIDLAEQNAGHDNRSWLGCVRWRLGEKLHLFMQIP